MINHTLQIKTIKKMLTEIVLVLVACSMVGAGAYEIAKPGCSDECGGVKIPFPFGIGDPNCYYNNINFTTSYKIICNKTTNPPIPFIADDNYNEHRKLLTIDLNNHTIRASSGVAFSCYTLQSEIVPSTVAKSYYGVATMYPFNISSTNNMFVAVGCDTTAIITDEFFDGPVDDSTGCITSCTFIQGVTNGSCSGQGCCQTSMINTMFQPSIHVDSTYNHSGVAQFNPCGYAFVGEVGSYSFSTSNLSATAEDLDKMSFPVVYDWHLALSNICSESSDAKNNICGSNTRFECVQVLDLVAQTNSGYRCHCLEGYTGNPYLPQGCQDINECEEQRLNDCQRLDYCVNKDGGYDCRCPNAYHGNGTTTSPCIPVPGDTKLVLGLSIGMGTMIGFILLYGAYKLLKRRKEMKERQHNFKKNGGLLLQQEMSANEGVIDRTKIFSKSELEKATDNFNNSRVLGRGGQGTVYKGMLADGTIIAVKKSQKVDEGQLGQFINEVVILSQINHRNIVKLFGCCLETKVPLLVYEYVPNGTLYQHIHHPVEEFHMTWKVRFQIALECARAIAYLHSSCSAPIYHRDIKSSNILLDEKYKAKVSDFGTSKSISIDKTHVTTFIKGTFGYLDPEFFRSSHFSEKSDVYSFGVVLLELITSKKAIYYTDESSDPKGLAQLVETDPTQLHNVLDTQVLQHCSEEEIETITKLIRQCLSLNGKKRPTMREVAMTLEMIKSKHDEEANPNTEQGEGSEGIDDQMGITVEESYDTSIDNDTFDSMNLEPMAPFDSN